MHEGDGRPSSAGPSPLGVLSCGRRGSTWVVTLGGYLGGPHTSVRTVTSLGEALDALGSGSS
ncbi:hypothetical protein ACIQMR_13445 [Streptomyces sp. NPDC091376]|uniref:hypothetical protein n=1 Tax=Streptomyces sp. NPDC091376 TaxID=3365994 RepID=UPI0037F1DDDD